MRADVRVDVLAPVAVLGPLKLWEVGSYRHGCREQTRVLDNSGLALNHWVISPVSCINGLGFRVFVSISEEMVWTLSYGRTFNSKGTFWPSEDTIPGGSGSVLGYQVSESFLRQLKGPWLISWHLLFQGEDNLLFFKPLSWKLGSIIAGQASQTGLWLSVGCFS